MKIKIKPLSEKAVIPKYAKYGDAGMDLTATSEHIDEYGNVVYGTDLAVEIPINYVGLIFPRSSNSKKDVYLTNHVGVVDAGYRGEIYLKFRPIHEDAKYYDVGDRIAQLIVMPIPEVEFEIVDQLDDTNNRGGGYGSTGK